MNKTQQLLQERSELFDKEFPCGVMSGEDNDLIITDDIKSFHATTILLLLNSIKEDCCEDCRKIIEKHGTF